MPFGWGLIRGEGLFKGGLFEGLIKLSGACHIKIQCQNSYFHNSSSFGCSHLGVATADSLLPFFPVPHRILRLARHPHFLFYNIHIYSLWSSPLTAPWQLHPQHPFPNVILFPPHNMSPPSQSPFSHLVPKLSYMGRPSDKLIHDLVQLCNT